MDRRIEIMKKVGKNCKIDFESNPQDPCWVWTGPTSGKVPECRGGGYPRMSLNGRTVAVHRVVFTHYHGFIPGKMQIDHKCNNRLCLNPEHLEIVTHKENQRRRDRRLKAEK